MSITKMRELTKNQSTDALTLAYNELDTTTTRETRTDAERLTISVIGGELSTRQRREVQKLPTATLLETFRTNTQRDYAAMTGLERMDYNAISDELEVRYPDAAEHANEWIDGISMEELQAGDSNAWCLKFLEYV